MTENIIWRIALAAAGRLLPGLLAALIGLLLDVQLLDGQIAADLLQVLGK